MASPTDPDPDVTALQAELKQLRADFDKIAGTIRGAASHGIGARLDETEASAERVWSEIKCGVQSAGRSIETRPIAAALAAFGAGALLGLLLSRRGR